MHRGRRSAAAAIFLAIGLGSGPQAQSPAPPPADAVQPPAGSPESAQEPTPPTFRGGLELVQLDVSVLDERRQPVTGLTAAEFIVLEDGVSRPLRSAEAVRLPVASSASAPRAETTRADVTTNRVGHEDGRLVVILMDRTIAVGEPTLVARRIAAAAIEALGPRDLAAIVSTSGGTPQNLTADKARLLDAVNQRDWSTGISPEQEGTLVGRQDPLSDPRCLCGLCVLEAVTNISDAVQHAPRRRKTLLFIGSSVIFQSGPRAPSADVNCGRRLVDARGRLFDSVARSNLTVHSVDPGGLTNYGFTRAGTGGSKPGGSAVDRRQALQGDINRLLDEQGSLHVLPDLTGGRTITSANRPQEAMPEIFRESESYYVLAFEPGPGPPDRPRTIDVRVARRGVKVHARRTLVPAAAASAPPGGGTPQPIERALTGLLPDASRPLALATAAFAGEAGKAIVLVTVDAGSFAPESGAPAPLEIAFAAFDRAGRQAAFFRDNATIAFRRSASGAIDANVQAALPLDAGDYEIRVAVADPSTGAVASVFREIAIPPFGGAPLSVSDMILDASGAADLPGAQLAAAGTTRRVFRTGERVRAIVQIYQGLERTAPLAPVTVRTVTRNAAGTALRVQELALSTSDFTGRRTSLALEIGDLPQGDYVLTMEASAGPPPVGRAVRFSVR